MKKLLTLVIVAIMAAISCGKEEEDRPVAVLESYDANTMTLSFTATLTEDDLSAAPQIGLSISHQNDPYMIYLDYFNKEKMTIIPREENVYYGLNNSDPGSRWEKLGRHTYSYYATGFHPGQKYYLRFYVRMYKGPTVEDGFEIMWSNLIEIEMPRPGEPYIRSMEFSNVGSTSADARTIWASNGQHMYKQGYIISTSKSEVEKEEGLSGNDTSWGDYHFTDLLPSTTYYVRFWTLLENPFPSYDFWMDGMFYFPEVYSFTTLAQ